MDTDRFDATTRSLTTMPPRRGILRGLAGAALGLVSCRPPANVAARKRRRKKKTPRLNEFGCLNVGQKCRGKDKLCCSGICAGKKPKHGGKDRRRCAAHDTGGCPAGERQEACSGGFDRVCTSASGQEGVCNTTTGNAGFCAVSGDCFPCQRDADCQPLCGPGAACVRCAETCLAAGGAACFGPGDCDGF